MTNVSSAVKLLRREHDRLTQQIKGIAAALEAFGAAYGKQNGTRRISAAERARIASAQKARSAKTRNNGRVEINKPKKRTMSATAKRRIAAAQKKRWAAWRAKKAART